MEKKNTILLTVIAIATLLVAVVGATFAYFTATVQTDTKDGNNTTSIKTYALASAKMAMGDKVEAVDVYPGYKAVKSVTVTGNCPKDVTTCDNIDATIKVIPTIDEAFGTDVTWKLYESSEAITCPVTPNTDGGQYRYEGECVIPTGANVVIDSTATPNASGEYEYNVEVVGGEETTYYLVVEYRNDTTAPQNTQQGKSYTVALDFVSR